MSIEFLYSIDIDCHSHRIKDYSSLKGDIYNNTSILPHLG